MNSFDIIVVGGLEYVAYALNSIVYMLGSSTFSTMIRLSFLIAAVFLVLRIVGDFMGRQSMMVNIKNFFLGYMLLFGFFGLKADVLITDTKTQQQQLVRNVPYGVAFIHSMFSQGSYYLSKMIDSAIGSQSIYVLGGTTQNQFNADIGFTRCGFACVSDVVLGIKRNLNPAILQEKYQTAVNYISQCFLQDFQTWSEADQNNLLKSKDPIGSDLFKTKQNYLMSDGGNLTDCWTYYDRKFKPAVEDIAYKFTTTPEVIGLAFGQGTGALAANVVNLLTGGSQQFQQIVNTEISRKVLQASLANFGSSSEELSKSLLLAYSIGESEGRLLTVGKSIGLFAKEIIPVINIVFLVIVIGITPFYALSIMFPSGLMIFKAAIKTTIWAYLWQPTMALLDGIVRISAIAKTQLAVSAGVLSSEKAYTLMTSSLVHSEAEMIAALAGYLAISTPGIAWMILTGSDYAVSNLASSLSSISQVGQLGSIEGMARIAKAEAIGHQLGLTAGFGGIGSGFAVRAAVDTNASALASGLGSDLAGMALGSDIFKQSYFSTASSALSGSQAFSLSGAANFSQLRDIGRQTAIQNVLPGMNIDLGKALAGSISQKVALMQSKGLNEIISKNAQFSSVFSEYDSFAIKTMNGMLNNTNVQVGNRADFQRGYAVTNAIYDGIRKSVDLSDKQAANITSRLIEALALNPKLASSEKDLKQFIKSLGVSAGLTWEKADTLSEEFAKQNILSKMSGSDFRKAYEARRTVDEYVQKSDSFTKDLSLTKAGDEGKKYSLDTIRSYNESIGALINNTMSLEEAFSKVETQSATFGTSMLSPFLKYVAQTGNFGSEAEAVNYLNSLRNDGNIEKINELVNGFIYDYVNKAVNIKPDTTQEDLGNRLVNFDNQFTGKQQQITETGKNEVLDNARAGHSDIDALKFKNGVLITQVADKLNARNNALNGVFNTFYKDTEKYVTNSVRETYDRNADLNRDFYNEKKTVEGMLNRSFGERLAGITDIENIAGGLGILAVNAADFLNNTQKGNQIKGKVQKIGETAVKNIKNITSNFVPAAVRTFNAIPLHPVIKVGLGVVLVGGGAYLATRNGGEQNQNQNQQGGNR